MRLCRPTVEGQRRIPNGVRRCPSPSRGLPVMKSVVGDSSLHVPCQAGIARIHHRTGRVPVRVVSSQLVSGDSSLYGPRWVGAARIHHRLGPEPVRVVSRRHGILCLATPLVLTVGLEDFHHRTTTCVCVCGVQAS